MQTSGLVDKLAARNNALKTATPKGSAGNYYDLSTKGGSEARNTANCYVISAPGYYKIPLVYGNAIENGSTNSHAYKTSNTGAVILSNFIDHAGQPITNPWIEKTNGGANNGVDGAKIVWADETNLVHLATGSAAITHDASGDGFLEFEVKASDIKTGNAVVAVTKGGTIVWSWHLWFAPQDVLNTIACTNATNHVYKFTKENLGWKYDSWQGTSYSVPRKVKIKVEQEIANGGSKQHGEITITQNPGNVRHGNCPFFQWGRKDAFLGIDAPAQGSWNVNGSIGSMSFQNFILHPETFYGTWSGWAANLKYNPWSMDNTTATAGFNDNAVVKTIYDPCPAGFHIPASNAFTGFSTTGVNTTSPSQINASGAWNYGWDFNNKITNPDATIYFPTANYRFQHDGTLYFSDGAWGVYCSAVPNNNAAIAMSCMVFSSTEIRPLWTDNYIMPAGYSVRPVAE